MAKLAIDGGTSVFGEKRLAAYAPKWPISYPETEQKLLDLYRKGPWGGCLENEQALMKEFAAWQGVEYSVWMANGTTTLECALLALGVGPGDEVIVPAVSWLATAETPIYVGATPVLVDIDPKTLCIDPKKIEEAITPRTKAIIPVHLFSAVADMDAIMAIAKKHNLYVIEDCAHAHGARQHGKGVGSIGNAGSFSFQSSKLMTSGEGGCCTSNSLDLADLMFRASHISSSKLKPTMAPPMGLICHQYRMTEFQSTILRDQIPHQNELKAKRKASVERLAYLLKDTPGIAIQQSSCPDDERAFYFFCTLLDLPRLKPGIDRDKVMQALDAEGVSLNIGWGFPIVGMRSWTVPADRYILKDTPVSDEAMYKRELVCSHSILLVDQPQIDMMAEAINKVMTEYAE